MDRLISPNEVEDNLGLLERVVSYFSGNDDFKAAMLNNQIVQTKIMSDLAGVQANNQMDPTNLDMDDLPRGLVGTAETDISSNEKGRAIFDIGGSKFEAKVTAESDIDQNEIVVINSSGNSVRQSERANDALSVMVGSGEAGRDAVMRGSSINIYETKDLPHANQLGSVILDPGEEAVIASTGEDISSGYLMGVGAYNHQGVEYAIIVDEEETVGGWTKSPLGTVNDMFWFPDSMGGVVKFTENANYVARYSDDEDGQAEIVSRIATQEF